MMGVQVMMWSDYFVILACSLELVFLPGVLDGTRSFAGGTLNMALW